MHDNILQGKPVAYIYDFFPIYHMYDRIYVTHNNVRNAHDSDILDRHLNDDLILLIYIRILYIIIHMRTYIYEDTSSKDGTTNANDDQEYYYRGHSLHDCVYVICILSYI